MDGKTNKVRAHYTGDAGSNAADRVRALLETLASGLVSTNLARSVREGSLGLLMGLARAI